MLEREINKLEERLAITTEESGLNKIKKECQDHIKELKYFRKFFDEETKESLDTKHACDDAITKLESVRDRVDAKIKKLEPKTR